LHRQIMAMRISIQKQHTFTGHSDCVYTLEPGVVPHQFFSGAGDGMVVLWDLLKPNEGQLLAKLPHSVYALHHHAESNLLIAGHNHSGIHVLDWQHKTEKASLQITTSQIFDINSVDNLLLVGTGDGTLITLNLKTLKVVEQLKLSSMSIRTLAVNHELNEVAIGYSDNHIRVLRLTDFSVKYDWEAHTNSVFTLRYLPGSHHLVSGSRDARLKVWDSRGGYTLMNEVVAHLYAINHLAISPDGKRFVTGSMDKSIKVWDTETQQLLKVIDRSRHAGHGTSVNKVWWSPHENQVISASDDRTISVWNIIFE
jgi:WD40 repeat protein